MTYEERVARREWASEAAQGILEAQAARLGVDPADLKGRRSQRLLRDHRADTVAMMRLAGLSFPEIGRALDIHHTTALHRSRQ